MICVRKECRAEFEPRRRHQKYCSRDCRYADQNEKNRVVRVTTEEAMRIRAARDRSKKRVTRFASLNLSGDSNRAARTPLGANLALDEPLMVTSEVARMLRVSEWAVRYWRMRKVKSGPPFIKIGRLVRYFREDVLSFARMHRIGKVPASTRSRREIRKARPA